MVGEPLFFRIWVIWLGTVLILYALYGLHRMGWLAQPAYLLVLVAFFTSKARDVCARCSFHGKWHCGGMGKLASSFVSPKQDPIPMHRSQTHYALLLLVVTGLLIGLFFEHFLAGTLGVVWVVVSAVSTTPRGREYSWKVGRDELNRRAETPLNLARSPRGSGEVSIHQKHSLGFSEGIDLVPMSPGDEIGGIEMGSNVVSSEDRSTPSSGFDP